MIVCVAANPSIDKAAAWGNLTWNAATPAGTTLKLQVAAGDSVDGPFNFVGPDGTASSFFTTSGASLAQFNGHRYLKYKVLMTTTNSAVTPTLNDLQICFDNAISDAAVTSAVVSGGTRLQQLQNQIAIEVRNAQFTVQQNRAQVLAAQSAEELARQSLDAEQKKYALGASTTTLVLTAQRDLAQAQANSVAALDNYEKSKVQLDLSTGLTLTHNGIQVAEAETGKVQTMPHVPGIVPRQPSQELQMEQEPQSGVPQPETLPQQPPAGTQPQTVQPQNTPEPQAQPQPQPQTAPEPQSQPQSSAPGTLPPSGGQLPQPATPQPQNPPQTPPQPQQ